MEPCEIKDFSMKIFKQIFKGKEIISGWKEEEIIVKQILDYLRDLGYDARALDTPCMSWRENYVEVKGEERRIPALALPYSPSGYVEAPLVYVGYGIEEEEWEGVSVEGKIALLEWYGEELDEIVWQYKEAVKRGAVGVIVYDAYPGVMRRIVVHFSDDYRYGPGIPPPVPVVSTSRLEGLRLIKLAKRGVKISLNVETEVNHQAKGYTIEAVGDEDETFTLLTAHHDHWLSGFGDNVLGVAMLLLLAKELRNMKGIRFVSFCCEESGTPNYSPWYWLWGSRSYVNHLKKKEKLEDVKIVINIDVATRNPIKLAISSPEMIERIKNILGINAEYELGSPYFDSYSFMSEGLPSITIHSMDSYFDVYHTNRDTPTAVEWDAVAKVYLIVKNLVFKSNNIINNYDLFRLIEVSVLNISQKLLGEKIDYKRRTLNANKAKELRKALILPVFEGDYSKDHGPFKTFFIPQLLIARDYESIKKAVSLLEIGQVNEALKILESIPSKRIIPGKEEVITCFPKHYLKTLFKVSSKENIVRFLKEIMITYLNDLRRELAYIKSII